MPRTKQYVESDVIEKATDLFWRLGYTNTSMRLLEEAMGINKFSIYTSFGSKEGLFIQCLECYIKKMAFFTDKMSTSNQGIPSIKQYFYDFLDFCSVKESGRGCLIASTASEQGSDGNEKILDYIQSCATTIKSQFKTQLALDPTKTEDVLVRQSNYLIIALLGLCNATKIFEPQSIRDFIETTFQNLK